MDLLHRNFYRQHACHKNKTTRLPRLETGDFDALCHVVVYTKNDIFSLVFTHLYFNINQNCQNPLEIQLTF